MKKAVLIVGLPASGKTTFIKNNFDGGGWLTIDDPIDYEQDVVNKIAANPLKDIVIADPYFCFSNVLTLAISKLELLGFKLEILYFENNPEKCLRNMKYRNNTSLKQQKVSNFIIDASNEYTIPETAVPMSIWDGSVNQI